MSILKEYDTVYLAVVSNHPGISDAEADAIAKYKMVAKRVSKFPGSELADQLLEKHAKLVNKQIT